MAKNGRPSFELSVDAIELIKRLEEVPPGAIISWNDLSESIGRDVRGEARSMLYTARKHLMDQGVVFETVHNVGLKHELKSEVIRAVLPDTTKRVRSLLRRQGRKLQTISDDDYKALPKSEQTQYNTTRALFSTFQELTKESAVKHVKIATAKAEKPLPLAQTLAALSGNTKQ